MRSVKKTCCQYCSLEACHYAPASGDEVRGAKAVAAFCADIKHDRIETLRAIFVCPTYKLLTIENVALGGSDELTLYTSRMFRPAVERKAFGLYLCHNHPSGDPRPSSFDIDLTDELFELGQLLKVQILDHVIIAGDRIHSMAESGDYTFTTASDQHNEHEGKTS